MIPFKRVRRNKITVNKNKLRGPIISGLGRRKYDCRSLEREIKAAAHHAEVILRTVNKVPAEIIDPADVRREADFETAADLADSLALRICMTSCHDLVEAFPRFTDEHIVRPLATAKDRAAPTNNARRKPRPAEWVTQGQGA